MWSRLARADLEAIEAFVASDNPAAAAGLILRIRSAVEKLLDHPASGRAGRVVTTRELVIAGTPYIVPYRVRPGRLEILRVFHAARRWPERL